MQLTNLLTAILLFFFTTNLTAQSFEIDNTFGETGIVRTKISKSTDFLESLLLLKDDKILLGGYTALDSLGSQFVLVKYNADGSLEETFGETGVVITGFNSSKSFLRTLDVGQDQKIMAYGTVNDFGNKDNYIAFVRYHNNGVLDESFGNNGKVLTKSADLYETVSSIRKQGKDKIIVLAYSNNPIDNGVTRNGIYLKRYFIDGALDKTFGTDGKLVLSTGEQKQSFRSISITDKEEIIVFGRMGLSFPAEEFLLRRYSPDGRLDLSFGNNGSVSTNFGLVGHHDEETTIQQPDGKILALGNISILGKNDFILIRYHPDGSIDEDFGENGKVITELSDYTTAALRSHDTASGLTMQTDGKIIVTGGTALRIGTDQQFVLVRYDSTGKIDESFGTKGKITQSIEEKNANGVFPVFQTNGKIILGGIIRDLNVAGLNGEFFIARYLTELSVGVLDFSLNSNSMLIYPNPIKNSATLIYTLETPEYLTIQLIDLHGRILKTYLQNKPQKAGTYQQSIDLPTYLPTGMYFVRLSSPNGQTTIKVTK